MLQKFATPVPELDPLFTSPEAQAALQRTIALHFLRTGQFDTADVFMKVGGLRMYSAHVIHEYFCLQESDVNVPPEMTSKFVDLHAVLTALRQQNIGLALEYVVYHLPFP